MGAPVFKGLDSQPNDRRKRTAKNHEQSVARVFAGVTTIGSGNKGMKGDVFAGDPDVGHRLMVECKATEKAHIAVKAAWLEKLTKEAREAGREPVLALRWAVCGESQDWALIPIQRWRELGGTASPALHAVIGRHMTFNLAAVDRLRAFVFFNVHQFTPRMWVALSLDGLKDLYAAQRS